MKTELKVRGIHCRSCELLIKDLAEGFPAITSCHVDVKTGKVVLEHKESFEIEKFKREVESLGEYKVEIVAHFQKER